MRRGVITTKVGLIGGGGGGGGGGERYLGLQCIIAGLYAGGGGGGGGLFMNFASMGMHS